MCRLPSYSRRRITTLNGSPGALGSEVKAPAGFPGAWPAASVAGRVVGLAGPRSRQGLGEISPLLLKGGSVAV